VGLSVTLSDSRAQAAIQARRFGVPPAMIEAATQRRLAGDWRGACAAADVDLHLNPDAIRRRHGADVAGQLLADLRSLAPDLLRWHMPRWRHGSGQLLEGLLIPLADYTATPATLTLAAATPRFAVVAGQRIVLVVAENVRRRDRDQQDPGTRAVFDGVHRRSGERHSLRRHRMFWDADAAPGLASIAGADDAAAGAREITRLQDTGQAPAAWAAAGIDMASGRHRPVSPDRQGHLTRWLATVPVNLPLLAHQVRQTLPGAGQAVIRPGGGAIVLRGLDRPDGAVSADVVAPAAARSDLPVVPEAAWARPVDADLLRLGLLRPHELHPLVAAALAPRTAVRADSGRHDWLYAAVPGIEAECAHGPGSTAVVIHCGSQRHRVAQRGGRWEPVDHGAHPARETLIARLGGPLNPCLQAADYLSAGQHVIDLVEHLMEHGRTGEALRLLREHADASAAPEAFVLHDGTLGEALSSLREKTLRLRMILSGAALAPDTRDTHPPTPNRRHSRKGEPARQHR